jgi:UDP-glucose:(heptosyl)LPS alpha-1,3-glucosyltransferase
MKIAIIRRKYTPTGGAELYAHRLLMALVQAGHEVHLFSQEWIDPNSGIKSHRVNSSRRRGNRVIDFALSVRKELIGFQCDCVFSLERTIFQDVYRAGDGVHRVWLRQRRKYAPWWKKPFVGFGAFHRQLLDMEPELFNQENTRHIIVNSAMVRGDIIREFNYPESRIHLVRNGIETSRFQNGNRQAARKRFGIRDDEYLLLFVGSGLERKGYKYLLKPLKQLDMWIQAGLSGASPYKRARLLVVGKDRPFGTNGDSIIYAGPMADVENAYAAADLFAFLPIYEPAANVVCEAIAAGLPVVTSALNGAAEWLQEGTNGTTIQEPADWQAALSAFKYWMNHPRPRVIDCPALSMERNLTETMNVLEMAAQERRSLPPLHYRSK